MSIDAIIDAAALKNPVEVRAAFDAAIAPKLAAAIEAARPGVAAEMFGAPAQEEGASE